MKERNYCLVWSQQDTLITPPVITSDFLYLRLIGDRSIDERYFDKIKKDRTKEMQLWSNIIKDIQKNEKNIKTAIIAANNHYAGFGPMTAKLFADMMNLKNQVRTFPILDYKIHSFNEVKVTEEENKQNFRLNKQLHSKTRQTDISDFFK